VFLGTMRSKLVSVFSDAMASSKVPVLDMATRYDELGSALLPLINPYLAERYGIELTGFVVENVSLPPAVEEAIDKRSSMAAIGNLNDYVKYNMANSIGNSKGDGGGMGPMAAQMAMGFGMTNQMMNQPGGMFGPQATPAAGAYTSVGGTGAPMAGAPAAAAAVPAAAAPAQGTFASLLGVPEAAQLVGVSESDIVACLEKGDLKGKKIGSTWRILRSDLEAFLGA